MKTDFYTKTVLTFIAFCLSILTLQSINLIPKAYASGPKEKNSNVVPNNYAVIPLNANGSIDVNIKSSAQMDVNIVGISTSDELQVDIDEVGGFSTFGTIPVKIKD